MSPVVSTVQVVSVSAEDPDSTNVVPIAPRLASLGEVIGGYVQRYLHSLGDALDESDDVYDRFLAEMERPLLTYVLARCDNNQLRAARVLGINRNTLRKKLAMHGIIAGR
jgi:two-component system nitrogen regulation response regulator GlnG